MGAIILQGMQVLEPTSTSRGRLPVVLATTAVGAFDAVDAVFVAVKVNVQQEPAPLVFRCLMAIAPITLNASAAMITVLVEFFMSESFKSYGLIF
jgi:hypothetical protein